MSVYWLLIGAGAAAALIWAFGLYIHYRYQKNCRRMFGNPVGLAAKDDSRLGMAISSLFVKAGTSISLLDHNLVIEGMASARYWNRTGLSTMGVLFIIVVQQQYGIPISRLYRQECDFIEVQILYCNGEIVCLPFDIVSGKRSFNADEAADLIVLRSMSVMAENIERAKEIWQRCLSDL